MPAAPIDREIFWDKATATTINANRFTLLGNMGQSWGGCVETRAHPYDVQDTAPTTGTPATLYTPYFAPDEPDSRSKSGNANGDFGSFSNDYLPDELAALYAAIIGEAVPEFRRLDAAIANRLR
jgi:hypothetical protein